MVEKHLGGSPLRHPPRLKPMDELFEPRLEAFPRHLVEAVDSLIEFAKNRQSPNGRVEWDGDWEVIRAIFQLFAVTCPEECQAFVRSQRQNRALLSNPNAIVKQGEARMQHMLEVPELVDFMIKTLFPRQRTQDRKFITRLSKVLPVLKVGEGEL